MRLQIASVVDAVVLISGGVAAVATLGVRRVRRTPHDGAVVAVTAEG